MAFSPSFTVSQDLSNPGAVTLTDDSSGSDAEITQRRVYFTDESGNYIVPSGTSTDYVLWPLATNPITINSLLQVDTSVNILVEWLNVSNAVLYDDNNDFCLRAYNKQQFVYLIQQQALNPGIVQDGNYYSNLCQYWINIQGANTMVVDAEDLSGSQNCLNRATEMLQNESKYF
jgi:hypothetical protein